jgi:hypothetical protein
MSEWAMGKMWMADAGIKVYELPQTPRGLYVDE